MSRFPAIEAQILRDLEHGEARPPEGLLHQEWFWLAAAQLQARGLCVADQAAGVVRRPPVACPVNDLPSRLRLLLGRWRARETGSARQCAIDLEEVMEECGVSL